MTDTYTFAALTDGTSLAAVRNLYESSFPEAERRPWDNLLARHADGSLQSYGMCGSDGRPVAFVNVWPFDGYAYVEHFAVDPSLRGCGMGARILEELAAIHPALVLEVERPDAADPMAARRIEFYRRNGFVLRDYDYVQPPYAEGLPSLPMLLMSRGCDADSATVAARLHSSVYGAMPQIM